MEGVAAAFGAEGVGTAVTSFLGMSSAGVVAGTAAVPTTVSSAVGQTLIQGAAQTVAPGMTAAEIGVAGTVLLGGGGTAAVMHSRAQAAKANASGDVKTGLPKNAAAMTETVEMAIVGLDGPEQPAVDAQPDIINPADQEPPGSEGLPAQPGT